MVACRIKVAAHASISVVVVVVVVVKALAPDCCPRVRSRV